MEDKFKDGLKILIMAVEIEKKIRKMKRANLLFTILGSLLIIGLILFISYNYILALLGGLVMFKIVWSLGKWRLDNFYQAVIEYMERQSLK